MAEGKKLLRQQCEILAPATHPSDIPQGRRVVDAQVDSLVPQKVRNALQEVLDR